VLLSFYRKQIGFLIIKNDGAKNMKINKKKIENLFNTSITGSVKSGNFLIHDCGYPNDKVRVSFWNGKAYNQCKSYVEIAEKLQLTK
jgi:hypothetical protein